MNSTFRISGDYYNKNSKMSIHHTKCKFKKCELTAVYNYKHQFNGLYCKYHKLTDMIYIYKKRYQICNITNCLKRANYNFKDKKALICKEHKVSGMVYIGTRRCANENCLKTARYGSPKIFCKKHNELDNHYSELIEYISNIPYEELILDF